MTYKRLAYLLKCCGITVYEPNKDQKHKFYGFSSKAKEQEKRRSRHPRHTLIPALYIIFIMADFAILVAIVQQEIRKDKLLKKLFA